MLKSISMCFAVACASLGLAMNAQAQVTTVRVASGLTLPLYVASPIGDNARLFIVEQRNAGVGRIRVLDITTQPPTLSGTIYLSIASLNTGNEEGLLGLAFHPNFLNNGYFWVYYTSGGNNHVVRYRANAPFATSTTADPASATTIITFSHPTQSNHNGGWIGFTPGDTQGYLHINTGDGGSGNDPPNNAQNTNAYLGKMLRIDIDGADNTPGNDDDDGVNGNGSVNGYTSPTSNPFFGPTAGLDEILHWGLRNPWRASFDRLNGNLYIGDVGQNAREEIDFAPAGAIGRNFGWRCMEGNVCTGLSGCTCNGATLTNPIHTYVNPTTGLAIIGGYVYRGNGIPSLQGTYFFADNASNQIWSLMYDGSTVTNFTNRTAELAPGGGLSIASVTSFGEDNAGELYIVDRGGEVYKVVPLPPANDTCVNATNVASGSAAFNTFGATTDGPDEGAGCGAGPTQIVNDLWYKFSATCTGTATVSVCGASFNTRLAAYGPCPTVAGQMLACNDDFCGSSSQISFPVTSGTVYRVRVGGATATTGNGTVVITCNLPPSCTSDVTGDLQVNVNDLLAVINAWGPCGGCPADIAPARPDGQVNVNDLLAVINGWGACP